MGISPDEDDSDDSDEDSCGYDDSSEEEEDDSDGSYYSIIGVTVDCYNGYYFNLKRIWETC